MCRAPATDLQGPCSRFAGPLRQICRAPAAHQTADLQGPCCRFAGPLTLKIEAKPNNPKLKFSKAKLPTLKIDMLRVLVIERITQLGHLLSSLSDNRQAPQKAHGG